MNTVRMTPIVFAIALIALSSPPTFAAPSAALRWDTCDDGSAGLPTDKDFAAPGVYTQVISGRGFSQPIYGLTIDLELRAPGGLPAAWRFDPAGCQAGALGFSLATVSKSCPTLGGGTIVLTSFTYDAVRGSGHVRLAATFNGLTMPNPASTYVLAQLQYDHSLSVAGSGGAGQCGGADAPVCFQLKSVSWNDAQTVEHSLPLTNALVTWQNPAATSPCAISPFTGVNIGEFMPQCVAADTTLQFIELGSNSDQDVFSAHLHVRVLDAVGGTRFDAGNLFGAALEGQPWPIGRTWLLGTRVFNILEGVPVDGLMPGAIDLNGGIIELYDDRDPGTILEDADYGPGTPSAVPPPGSSLTRGAIPGYYFATAPTPMNSAGQTAAAFTCPVGDESIEIRQFAIGCATGSTDGQYIELRAPVGQVFQPSLRLVVHDHSGNVALDQHGLFTADGAPWPAGRSWLLGATNLVAAAGISADRSIAKVLDPLAGTVDLFGGPTASFLVAHVAYGGPSQPPAPPTGYALTLQANGSYAIDPTPAPVNFAGATGAGSPCYCPGPLCTNGVFAGVRLDEAAFQCANTATETQFLVLHADAAGQQFQSGLGLRARDHVGNLLFDMGNLFPGRPDGTPWPQGAAWLIAQADLATVTPVTPDLVLPATLDPVGGTFLLYDRRIGGGVIQTLAYGPSTSIPAPLPGRALHRAPDDTWTATSVQDPQNAAGAHATVTVCPCPKSSIRLDNGQPVSTTLPARDTSSVSSHGRYDLVAGTSLVAASGNGSLADVRAADLYTIMGGSPGTPMNITVNIHCTGSAATQCDNFGHCSQQTGNLSIKLNGSPVSSSALLGTVNKDVQVPIQVNVGDFWRLDWETLVGVFGSSLPGSGNYNTQLSFLNLPASMSITSCNGYRFNGPTATLPAILVAQPSVDVVHLEWSSAPDVEAARVERMSDGAAWQSLGTATLAPDRLVFDDRTVAPGTRYAYRLRWAEGGADAFSDVTWVDVPAVRLALRSLTANPSLGAPTIEYTLPEIGVARLELLDLRGRRVWVRDLGIETAGSHAFAFAGGPPLAAGVYWARIVQAGNQAQLRLVVIGHQH